MTGGRLGLLMVTAVALTGYLVWSGDAALILPLLDQEKTPSATLQTTAALPSPKAETSGTPVLNPLSELKPDALNEMIERPLFNPTRAPAAAPVAEVAEPVDEAPEPEDSTGPQDFTLLGMASRDGIWTAVIRLNKTNEIFHLKQGEAMSEWTFSAVAAHEVTLSNNEKSIQLKLFQDMGNRPVPQLEQQLMQQPGEEVPEPQ
jgi:hypothetical protein